VLVVLLFLAAALAAAETGLTRMSSTRAEGLAGEDERRAEALIGLLADREATLSPLLLLRVASHLALAALVTVMMVDRFATGWAIVGLVLAVVAVYVLAEAIPRTWALQHPDRAALVAAPMVRWMLRVAPVRFVTRVLNAVANRLLPGPAGAPVVSEDELIALTEAAVESDAIEEGERELIESALELGDTVAREVMVPRTDMVTVDASLAIAEVLELAIERGFSRLPVCGEGIDDVVGLALVKDLARVERAGQGDRPVQSVMRRPSFVPETKRVDELLKEMRTLGRHMAIVIDEHGGTAGLVTLEDVVEELVGEIVDEYDREEPLLEPLAGGEALVHGRMPIDQLNGMVHAHLPDDNWDTVGGLIFNTLGHVPEVGESIEIGGLTLKVERMQGRRITRVRLTPSLTGLGNGREP
jgi:putative hemolysin